ncbi:MAG: hypothetical protein MUF15_25375, partial [Acidobacteria bacterium]|nr:hypothetical protein [Acidobacteriota bacterium]
GLFTNVLPLPVTITKTMNLKLWLANIQSRVLETKNFEYVVTQQVSQWTGVPLAILQEAIYTRTLVFLNYPIKKDDPKENSMNVTMTNEDTYPQVPLRLYVHPRDNFTSILYYNKNAFQPEESQFLLENFKKNLLAIIHTDEETPIFSLINGVNNDN